MIILILIIMIHIPFYICFRYPQRCKPNKQYSQMLILGCPCQVNGEISTSQMRRIQAAVYYNQLTPTSTILISGSGVKNAYVEADIMAYELRKQLPDAHIIVETKARNTYQNMEYVSNLYPSDDILIISGSSHLRRSYFFARKFYRHIAMGYGVKRDPWYFYLWEYIRMWNALYWEIRLYLKRSISNND